MWRKASRIVESGWGTTRVEPVVCVLFPNQNWRPPPVETNPQRPCT